MGTISLDEFIDIKTIFQNIPAQRKSLDLGLLVGKIPQNEGSDIFTDSERIRIYSSLTEMADDGFPSTNDLYKSASLFFSQDNHPKKLAIGKIGSVIEQNTADDGEILLADAKELNANAEVGKYIYHFVQVAIDEYRLSDTPVEGGQLIVSDTIPSDEILISDALTLNADAEVGKYIYQGYALSDTAETDYLEIVEVDNVKLATTHLPTNNFELTLTCNDWNKKFFLEGTFTSETESQKHSHEVDTYTGVWCVKSSTDNFVLGYYATGKKKGTDNDKQHTHKVKVFFKTLI